MRRKLGIAIAYAPGVISSSEGLARLLCFLIRGGIDLNYKVIILCPEWCRKDLDLLFKTGEIPTENDQIEIITNGQIPPLLTIHSALSKLSHKPRYPSKIKEILIWLNNQLVEKTCHLVGTTSWSVFITAIIIGLLLLPIIIPLFLIFFVASKIIQLSDSFLSDRINRRIVSPISQPLNAYKDDHFPRKIFSKMNQQEINNLSKIAHKQQDIQTWLVTTPFWPDLVKQLTRTVVVCPDVLITDFPVEFSMNNGKIIELRRQIHDSLNSADQIITYSDYVKRVQIIEKFAVNAEKITIIPHGHISIAPSLDILTPFESMTRKEQHDLCVQIVHNYLQLNAADPYLKNLDISGIRFLFYTSQIRASKNIPAFIKAYHILLRHKHEPVKLILTGDPEGNNTIKNLISDLGLERDVIFLPKIPTRVMAALYHLSILAVNPTLFEGGFPFTFSEAYSVGTPSIMAKIPVVEEFVADTDLQEKMLFDPYNIEEMAERIYWGLCHREELFAIQQPLYHRLKDRSWAHVAQEYIDVLDKVGKNN